MYYFILLLITKTTQIMYSVLYVDDEPGLLDIGKEFLEQTGDFRVELSDSAQDALVRIRTGNFDAIIADYQMPEMDGITFLREVRARYGNLPFILFTGRGREEVVILALNSGADFYLQKGGEPRAQFAELAHKIRQAIERRSAEKTLKNSERYLDSIIEMSPNSMWISDSTGTMIRMNQACRDMLQITDADVVGKYNLFHDNILKVQGYLPYVRNVFEKGEVARFVMEYDSAGLEGLSLARTVTRYLVVMIAPIRDVDGKITNAVIQHTDITAWKEAHMELKAAYEQLTAAEEELRAQYDELRINQHMIRESEEKFRVLAENGPASITVYQGSHNVYVNDYTSFMTGYTKEELYAMNFWDIIHPDFRELLKERGLSRQQGDNAPRRYEMKYITKAGEGRWADLSAATITFEGKPAGISMFIDITDRKKAEEELRAAYEQLKAAAGRDKKPEGTL